MTFAYLIPCKILHVYLPGMSVHMTYTHKNLSTCSKSANKPLTKLSSYCLLQVVNKFGIKLLTTCSKLVDIVRHVTRLLQQGCYNHAITILLHPCVVNLVTSCCIMTATVSDLLQQLVTGLIMPLSLLKVVNN